MRHHDDWLTAYLDYSSYSEAPRRMHFWAGVSAIAGALRRKVWIDQKFFKWFANMYIVLVAPPGIVSKSTTSAIAMSLLRGVPEIKFGPDVVTWPALVRAFAESKEAFQINEDWYPMSAMTLESSEFGNLVNPLDKEMVDLLVSLWDGKEGVFRKVTKTSGVDDVENPWINLIACTTPSWIAGNFPEYMIGGGFTSRCLFVYASEKAQLVAYPSLAVPEGHETRKARLIEDLSHIATSICGEYQLSPKAVEWGTAWYSHHYKNRPPALDDERFGGYIARKQTHIHKLSMILAASRRDALLITEDDLALADTMVTDLERDMPMVFSKIGREDLSLHAENFISLLSRRGPLPYDQAYRLVHPYFPDIKVFENIVMGAVRSGQIRHAVREGVLYLEPCAPIPTPV